MTQIVLFGNADFSEIKDQTWRATPFPEFFCYGSFWYVSTLDKKVFSAAPKKHFFLLGSNNSDSVVFENVGFREIKDHNLRITLFQNCFCYGSFT